jgi:hypothetical protein
MVPNFAPVFTAVEDNNTVSVVASYPAVRFLDQNFYVQMVCPPAS